MRLALALVATLGLSCASRPGLHRPPTGNLQPLDVGLEWTYDLGGRIQTRRIVGVERVGRFECATVEIRTGDHVERLWMRWDREGLKLHQAYDPNQPLPLWEYEDPPLLIHRLGSPSATWAYDERHGALTFEVRATFEGEDNLTVGDRVLPCARIRTVKKAGGRVAVDQTCWYSKDVGLVRMAFSLAKQGGFDQVNLQLTSWNFTAD